MLQRQDRARPRALALTHKTLKHYEILSPLGQGGMGVVYRARDTRLGRIVALKLLPAELARSHDRAQRFEREARIVSGLSHPGIATLYDFDREGDTAFLTMELVSGSTLRQRLEQGPLPLGEWLECGVQVAEALAAAHRAGVVHRDLKPENIMASESGYYKVLDFGVARIDEEVSGTSPATQTPTRTWATKAGSLVGTVAYMSPEQVLGHRADARSDLFSFGSVLYELATGRPPFLGTSDVSIAHAIAYEAPQPLNGSLTKGAELILAKCLAKDPAARYESAEQLAGDLRLLRANLATGVGHSRGLHARRASVGLGRRMLWIAVATVAALALAVTAWSLRPLPAPADARRDSAPAAGVPPRLVVAAFDNPSSDPEVEGIARALPQMLTTDLSRSAGLEVIASERLHDLLATAGRDPTARLDRSTTAELARWAGADLVISGSVFESQGRYRIDAQAYDTRSGTVIAARKAEGTEPFALVNGLTASLLEALDVAHGEEVATARAATASPRALRAFTRGKELYAELGFEEAALAFSEALEEDPAFTLARLQLALSLLAGGDIEAARPVLEETVRDARTLPELDRLLAEALETYYAKGDAGAGDERFTVLVERFPARAEVRLWWAHAMQDVAGKRLRAAKQVREALEIDPSSLDAVVTLARHLADVGQEEEARKLLAAAAERRPEAREALERFDDPRD